MLLTVSRGSPSAWRLAPMLVFVASLTSADAAEIGRRETTLRTDRGVIIPTLVDLVRRSELIVVARPIRERFYPTDDLQSVTTEYRVRVQQVLKGTARNGDRLTFMVAGGVHRLKDGTVVAASATDMLRVDVSQSYVLFLREAAPGASGRDVVGGAQGLFQLSRGTVIPMSREREYPVAREYGGGPMKRFLDDLRILGKTY